MAFQKATKEKCKLRCALFSPSGGGKTLTALRIATGMLSRMNNGSRIALIDTERYSASKYSDRFDFDVQDLQKRTINDYINSINDASSEGYPILIIDSGSHGWQELLEEIDKLARTKYQGNTWAAWSDGTPKQKNFIDAIVSYPGHVIMTMRSKTEWSVETDKNNKNRPVRIGLAPEQGKGIEYEFDLLIEMNIDHTATIIKDRTGKFQDKIIEKPGEEFGIELIDWLNEGSDPKISVNDIYKIANVCKNEYFIEKEQIISLLSSIVGREIASSTDLTESEAKTILSTLEDREKTNKYLVEIGVLKQEVDPPPPPDVPQEVKDSVEDDLPF